MSVWDRMGGASAVADLARHRALLAQADMLESEAQCQLDPAERVEMLKDALFARAAAARLEREAA